MNLICPRCWELTKAAFSPTTRTDEHRASIREAMLNHFAQAHGIR